VAPRQRSATPARPHAQPLRRARHLIVARGSSDSITPGWQQIGAVWLPLPHLLNVVPVQIDLFYQTGASAVLISVLSFAIATSASRGLSAR